MVFAENWNKLAPQKQTVVIDPKFFSYFMNNILIIGAGRSSSSLIKYALQQAKENGWFVTVADANPNLAQEKVKDHPNGRATWLDVSKVNDRRDLIERADVVVSLLPAHLHLEVAQDCIRLKKHLITASYVSKEMYRLGDEARDKELIFMGEMGLDPGIDHMSAKQKLMKSKQKVVLLRPFDHTQVVLLHRKVQTIPGAISLPGIQEMWYSPGKARLNIWKMVAINISLTIAYLNNTKWWISKALSRWKCTPTATHYSTGKFMV